MRGYSLQELMDSAEEGDPVMVGRSVVEKELRRHGMDMSDLVGEMGEHETYSALEVLIWLGY